MGAVRGHALRLVDRRGIAVVDLAVVLQVERDIAAVIGAHGHGLRADLLDGPERAVFPAKPALVLQEHDAVAGGEAAFAAFDADTHIIAKVSGLAHPVAGRLVQFPHLVAGVGEDNAADVRVRRLVAVPAFDQVAARLLPR
jgi:hypothetical protein